MRLARPVARVGMQQHLRLVGDAPPARGVFALRQEAVDAAPGHLRGRRGLDTRLVLQARVPALRARRHEFDAVRRELLVERADEFAGFLRGEP
ncbi:hypothetical protein D3C83_83340 [compost metagenome]